MTSIAPMSVKWRLNRVQKGHSIKTNLLA